MLGANATVPKIRAATDPNILLRRDHSVVKGFRQACNENIMDALDLEYYQGLRHSSYKYINIPPREFITNLETNFCSLDVNAVAKMKAHCYRGWETNEPLVQFPKQLKEDQARFALDSVTITIDDVFDHYLRELYASGGFSDETVIEWNDKNPLEQTFHNAIIFYENKKKGMDKVTRLTGNTRSGKAGFTSANQAVEFGEEMKQII